jgi:hypothetical protein
MRKIVRLIPKHEEEAVAEIIDKCRAAHVPIPPVTRLKFDLYNANGEHVLEQEQMAKSWVRNAYTFLLRYCPFGVLPGNNYGPGGRLIRCMPVSGLQDGDVLSSNISLTLPAGGLGSFTQGIILGTSDAAESFEHIGLQSQILSGNSAGQLLHNLGSTSGSYDIGTRTGTTTFQRIFNNNSGGMITVREIGMAGNGGGFTQSVLVSRDIISPAIEVADLAQLKVTYTTTLTFPA